MPDKLTIICYFQEDLKPSIKIQIEQQDRESVNFEEMVQKTVNAEAKAGLKSTIMVRDSDIYWLQGHCPSNNTALKVYTQETTAKDFSCPNKPKIKNPKSVPPYNNPAELAKKENKQKKFKRPQKRTKEAKETLATDDNTVNAAKKKKKHDTNKVTCFNYNKKDYDASNCTKPKN